MIKYAKLKSILSGLTLSVVIVASSVASVYAAPTSPSDNKPAVSGPQAKPPVEPESVDRQAKTSQKLGETNRLKVDNEGKAEANTNVTPLAGNVSGVDLQTPLNYCSRNRVYLPIMNTSGSTKYVHIYFYDQGIARDVYLSIPSATYPTYATFDGVSGAYSAYLYVWNGSSYVYDEYKSGTHTCNVAVSRVYNSGGWVQLKIQNLGTAYATQVSSELAPYPASGTYTGVHYDYPVAGGAAIYRWFQVGTSPYAITSYTSGSWNAPYSFTGDL